MSADGNQKVVEIKARDTEPKSPPSIQQVPAPAPAPEKPASNRRRYLIMGAVPVLLLAVGAYFWLSGGRYASTDNAYVQQDKVTITADVTGRIVEAPLRENDTVKAGQLLFRINPDPYKITLAGAEAALASARLQVEGLRAAYQ